MLLTFLLCFSFKDGATQKRSRNLANLRTVSLSGRALENHFQYAKPQPQGKLVDREGWLAMRLNKIKWKRCWFVFKGGALFRFREPTDELFVEQIIVTGASVNQSANRKGLCFKVEKSGEKVVFQAADEWDLTGWILALEKWSLPKGIQGKGDVTPVDEKAKRRWSFKK